MQQTVPQLQPHSLAPVARVGLAALVALALAGVVAVATSASHTAVRHASAQMQGTTQYVTLPRVDLVGRRAVASGMQGAAPEARSAAASTTACVQPT